VLLAAMLRATDRVTDLLFSPGRPPQIGSHGQLTPVRGPNLGILTADDTRRVAADIIGDNKQAITMLREQGSCDVSFGLAGMARFRANVFIQRGSCAVIMRAIPTGLPDFVSLGLPGALESVSELRDGIVLVGGARSSGKSSTLAALLDRINQTRVCHIVTVEDPIEFLHNHKCATIHQRELHSDAPSFAAALRAAMRQAPQVILVSEARDRETLETLFEAAETGHLVISSVNAGDVANLLQRVMGFFSPAEQASIRARMARTFRMISCQRLVPRRDGRRKAIFETMQFASSSNRDGAASLSPNCLLEDLLTGKAESPSRFDLELAGLVRDNSINMETALLHASNPRELADILQQHRT
jgi:twitching motility protein PilT